MRLITANCSALILNGTDLYSIDITTTASNTSQRLDTVELRPLGQLVDVDEPIVDVHYKKSSEYALIIVALRSHYQVYAIINARYNGEMRSIEKIALNGAHQRMLMFAQNDVWYCVVGNGLSGELGT